MPIYTLECPQCCLRSEHFLGMNDSLDDRIDCPMCTGTMTRREDRIYDVPHITGETVSGNSFSHCGYDEVLGENVRSEKHREDLMDQKGLTYYEPDPNLQKHRVEARKIRKSSRSGDMDAEAAVRKEYKTADTKRRTKLVNKALEKSLTTVVE